MALRCVLLGFFLQMGSSFSSLDRASWKQTFKRGSTRLEMVDTGKGNTFCQTYLLWGEKQVEEIE